jgi:hypothetical protein
MAMVQEHGFASQENPSPEDPSPEDPSQENPIPSKENR